MSNETNESGNNYKYRIFDDTDEFEYYPNSDMKDFINNFIDEETQRMYCLTEKAIPSESELDEMVKEIDLYYRKEFEITKQKEVNPVSIDIYINNTKVGIGESKNNEIKIGMTAIWKMCQEAITPNNSERLLNYVFRKNLAHEMFHIFHENAFKEQNGKDYSDHSIFDDPECETAAAVLRETMAEFFARCYYGYYQSKSNNPKKVDVLDYASVQSLFVGRKCLLRNFDANGASTCFTEIEIKEDYQKLVDGLNKGSILQTEELTESKNEYSDALHLFDSDYYSWSFLAEYSKTESSEDLQGKGNPLYASVFEDYQNLDVKHALYGLLNKTI